jgi:hypothetical protein
MIRNLGKPSGLLGGSLRLFRLMVMAKFEYKNSSEFKNGNAPIRTTNRAACSVARLAKEGELSLMQELAAAARIAARLEGTGDNDPGSPLVLAVRKNHRLY